MPQSANPMERISGLPVSGVSGYSFSAFSAADVSNFRSPFGYAVRPRYVYSWSFDAAIETEKDVDLVEELESLLRRTLLTSGVEQAVFGAVGTDAWRRLEASGRARGLFAFSLDVCGGVEYANIGHALWLMKEDGTITDLPAVSRRLALTPRVSLIAGNAAFARDVSPDRFRAALQRTSTHAAGSIRDAIAKEWAHSPAALQGHEDSCALVLRLSTVERHSRYTDCADVSALIGSTVGGSHTRSYGTTDLIYWLPRPTAASQAA